MGSMVGRMMISAESWYEEDRVYMPTTIMAAFSRLQVYLLGAGLGLETGAFGMTIHPQRAWVAMENLKYRFS